MRDGRPQESTLTRAHVLRQVAGLGREDGAAAAAAMSGLLDCLDKLDREGAPPSVGAVGAAAGLASSAGVASASARAELRALAARAEAAVEGYATEGWCAGLAGCGGEELGELCALLAAVRRHASARTGPLCEGQADRA